MNKTNTTNSTLNMIKLVCAERDRKERDRLRVNRLEMDKREEAEREKEYSIVTVFLIPILKRLKLGKISIHKSVTKWYRICGMKVCGEEKKMHTGQ